MFPTEGNPREYWRNLISCARVCDTGAWDEPLHGQSSKGIMNETDRRAPGPHRGPGPSKMKPPLKCTLLRNLRASPWTFCVIC